jgi:hypothetical protein
LTFDLEKYLVEKLDKIDERLDQTCNTLTEVKTIQKNFIEAHDQAIADENHKRDRKFDVRIALFGVAITLFEVYSYFAE